jgi:hypothetical protein
MKHLEHALATCVWNIWNIQKNDTCNLQHETTCCNIKLKQLKHFGTYCCNICMKYMQHPDKKRLQYTSGNKWNILNKCLQHASETLVTYATSPDLLLQHQNRIITTYIWNNWYIHTQRREWGKAGAGRLFQPPGSEPAASGGAQAPPPPPATGLARSGRRTSTSGARAHHRYQRRSWLV